MDIFTIVIIVASLFLLTFIALGVYLHFNMTFRRIFGGFLTFLGCLIFFLTIWMGNKYDRVTLDQFIYQMKSPATGANSSLLNSAFIQVGLFGILTTAFFIFLYLLVSGRLTKLFKNSAKYTKFYSRKFCKYLTHSPIVLSCWILGLALIFFVARLDVINYVDDISTDSDLIEREYVDPFSVELTYPEKKRNLIYIFLESMETTYADTEAGAPIYDDYIPELSSLAKDYINFSHDDDLGGAYSFSGTTWTAAAMVSQTSGMIVQVPLTAESYGGENKYIPGLVSIGEVLEKAGYHQTLLVGSDAAFAGRYSYFSEHGNYEIIDINVLKEQGRLDPDYREFWGFEDEKLFAYAKEELTRIAELDQPFNFTMLTCDTHFPDGYVCRLCEDHYEEQYPNVMRCSSKQVGEFIEWIQQQPFYENTTIVICGDHLTMDPDFFEEADPDYVRTIYNCIINSPIKPKQSKNREFGTFDMFPTTLAALGVKIEGDRLGLGTNLFSKTPTLTEHYGYDILDNELKKNSEFYNREFLQMETETTE
ncbi:MAG: LTA synthase family protein [Ruminococcaceae bacterium]|nr:LTA synthase family protein [Oscillospiraceae bacterium]